MRKGANACRHVATPSFNQGVTPMYLKLLVHIGQLLQLWQEYVKSAVLLGERLHPYKTRRLLQDCCSEDVATPSFNQGVTPMYLKLLVHIGQLLQLCQECVESAVLLGERLHPHKTRRMLQNCFSEDAHEPPSAQTRTSRGLRLEKNRFVRTQKLLRTNMYMWIHVFTQPAPFVRTQKKPWCGPHRS